MTAVARSPPSTRPRDRRLPSQTRRRAHAVAVGSTCRAVHRRDGAAGLGVPLSAWDEQVEQDRAPALLSHHGELARHPADDVRDHRRPHRERPDSHRAPGRVRLFFVGGRISLCGSEAGGNWIRHGVVREQRRGPVADGTCAVSDGWGCSAGTRALGGGSQYASMRRRPVAA